MAKKEEQTEEESKETTFDLSSVEGQFALLNSSLSDSEVKEKVALHIQNIVDDSGLDEYEIVLLFDENKSISGFHSDKIYRAIADLKGKKNMLMLLESG
jgi:hypothetical protein